MNNSQLVTAFNEWMRRYIEEPDKFTREFQDVTQFLSEQNAGQTPSYGEECAAYLTKLVTETTP